MGGEKRGKDGRGRATSQNTDKSYLNTLPLFGYGLDVSSKVCSAFVRFHRVSHAQRVFSLSADRSSFFLGLPLAVSVHTWRLVRINFRLLAHPESPSVDFYVF